MTQTAVNYGRVRRLAEELLGSQVKPPVQLSPIINSLDAELRILELAPDISGILYREGDRRVIIVNSSHGPERQRFTTAHEIGHLVLHKPSDVHVDHGIKINLRSPVSALAEDANEIEANAFAANLLMPASWLRNEQAANSIDVDDESEIDRLAKLYEVSRAAMLVRLATLNRSSR